MRAILRTSALCTIILVTTLAYLSPAHAEPIKTNIFDSAEIFEARKTTSTAKKVFAPKKTTVKRQVTKKTVKPVTKKKRYVYKKARYSKRRVAYGKGIKHTRKYRTRTYKVRKKRYAKKRYVKRRYAKKSWRHEAYDDDLDWTERLERRSAKRSYRARSKVSGRTRFSNIIAKHAENYGVPVKLAHAVIQIESNYRPKIRGGAGEVGLMQIKPATARLMGFRGSVRSLYNPDTNIKYGMKYLAGAYKMSGGTICGTVLRYNAGHGARRMNPISARYCRKAKRILGRR